MRILHSVVLCAVVMSLPALVAAAPVTGTNVRTQDDRLTQLLRVGSARSATLRALVDRIEASRVIVYVAINPQIKPNLSGMLTWMTQAGGYRYVRASISNDLSSDQMIATIAHELQHVVEVIEDETVNDENSLVALYRRIGQQRGHSSPSRWETDAAQQTGFVVRKELASAPMTTIVRAGAAGRS